MREWIAVEDGLPEKKESVLCVVEMPRASLRYQIVLWLETKTEWWSRGGPMVFANGCGVTHWQELPGWPE